MQASGISQECIIQDISVPVENTVNFLKYIDKDFGIYPIWLCPLLKDDKSPFSPNYLDTKLAINIGVWGKNDSKYSDILKANRQLENEVYKHKGKKVLYAQSYYDEKLFWKIYGGKDWYKKLRDKYNATKLPTIFDKVIVTKQYEISALKGVLFAFLGLNGIRKK